MFARSFLPIVVQAAVVVVALQSLGRSEIINVPGDQPSIQAGVNAANPGDEVVVAPGTYVENISFNGKAITVRSTDPTDPAVVESTIIDGDGNGSVVTCDSGEGPDTILNGLTVTGGSNAAGGGGIRIVNASPVISNNLIIDNETTSGGGGALVVSGSPIFRTNEFRDNSATTTGTGGGIHIASGAAVLVESFNRFYDNHGNGGGAFGNQGTLTVIDAFIQGNTANFDGGAIHNCCDGDATLVNVLITGNNGVNSIGAAVWNQLGGTMLVVNCTIAYNSGNVTGGVASFDSDTTIVNTIVWGNTPVQIAHSGSGITTVSYSDVQGGFSGAGNIDADPLFVDPDNGDLRLLSCSAVADAGINSAVPEGVTTDLDGNPRFLDDAGVADSGAGTPPLVDMGAYERQVDSVAGIINVPADFATIQAAIDAICGGEVVVAPGTYFESINFNGKAITVRSTDPTDPDVVAGTIINGGASGSVVTCASGEGPDSQLSGFTITNGNATDGGGMRNVGASPTVTNCTFSGNLAYGLDGGGGGGGGMFNDGSSPTVTNCTFSGNTADFWGGGMYNLFFSSPTMTDCTFSENSATLKGGGMFNFISSPTVTNCTFSGNETVDLDGGGMYNELHSDATVTNCTFSGNTAELSGGGMFNSNSSPTVTDSTFSENTAAVGGGMFNVSGSSPTVTNCAFSRNTGYSTGGGGMSNWFDSSPTVTNCTFSGNSAGFSGGGMYNYGSTSNPTVTNCILWDNVPNEISDDVGSMTTAAYSDIAGGFPGAGNIDADPLFVDPDSGDLRLQPGSLCIDAADYDAYVDAGGGVVDLGGDPRTVDDPSTPDTGAGSLTYLDMGTYEFQDNVTPGDCDGDGDIDLIDYACWLECVTGPDGGVLEDCEIFDWDGDDDVDLADFAAFQAAFTY